jgi:hypothetical protein
MTKRLPVPEQTMPSCRCSDCILSPASSHGIHLVGAYRPRVHLTSRGSTLPSGVEYRMPWSPGGVGGHGLVSQIVEFAQGNDYTEIIP